MIFLCVTLSIISIAVQNPMTFLLFTNNTEMVLNTFSCIYSNRTKKFAFGNKIKAIKLSAFGNFIPAFFREK